MSYYTNRRYAPPAAVYAASTLIGPHTGPRTNPCANCPNSYRLCAPCTRPDLNPGGRTCANCGQSRSNDPKCGLCTGPTTTTTRWEPIK